MLSDDCAVTTAIKGAMVVVTMAVVCACFLSMGLGRELGQKLGARVDCTGFVGYRVVPGRFSRVHN